MTETRRKPMRRHGVRFGLVQTRRGLGLKSFSLPTTGESFEDNGLLVEGILSEEGLRRALRTHFEFIFDQIIEDLKPALEGQAEVVERIRTKNNQRISRKRLEAKLTNDGGGKPQEV